MELRRRGTSERIALTHGMVLGRLPACDLTVDDASVSRKHARVEREGDAFVVVDQGSSNGVFQNGRRVERAELRAGDLLTLGSVAFDVLAKPRTTADAPARPAVATDDVVPVLGGEPAGDSGPVGGADAERARLRADVSSRRRSRGLGDLSQQPIWLRWTIYAAAIALMYGSVQGVRLLAGGV